MLAAGALVALAMTGSSGSMTQAAPAALYCAPTSPNFGIFADDLQAEQQDTLPAEVGCHGAGAPGPSNAAPNDSARNSADAQPEHTYVYGQMAPAMSEQAPADEESIWLEVYQAQAHDQAR
jgi:hypothetical protein